MVLGEGKGIEKFKNSEISPRFILNMVGIGGRPPGIHPFILNSVEG